MFLNREKELNALRSWFKSGKAQLIIIYGRRRVGKTFLIRRFFKEVNGIYFLVSRLDKQGVLKEFSRLLVDSGLVKYEPKLSDFSDLYRLLGDLSLDRRLVVAIDEFQRLLEADPSSLTLLQEAWDEYLGKSRIMLILLGSAVGTIERVGLSYSSPIYGRRTGQIKLDPFPYRYARLFLDKYPIEDKVRGYAVFGGTPAYLSLIDQNLPLIENIKLKILSKTSPLFEEPYIILSQETREPLKYMTILQAMELGSLTLGEIADNSGISSNDLPKYLKTLISELNIVKREYPIFEREKRGRARYFISDNFFRFWFRYVWRNINLLEIGDVETVSRKIVESIDEYVGRVFEEVCIEHFLWMASSKLISITDFGKWWRRDIEFDGVAVNSRENIVYFIEAKWSSKPIGREVLLNLIRRSTEFPWNLGRRREIYVIYSRSGFTFEKEEGTILIDLRKLDKDFESRNLRNTSIVNIDDCCCTPIHS